MAGSYNHVCPVPDEHGLGAWSLIENMGDAYECVEELLYLVLALAGRGESVEAADARIQDLLDTVYYPMARGERPKDDYYTAVQRVMQ